MPISFISDLGISQPGLNINLCFDINNKTIRAREVVLVVAFLLSVYTGVNLYLSESILIPNYISMLLSVFILITIRKSMIMSGTKFLFFIIIITAFGMVFSPESSKYFFERFKGFVHLFCSISMSYLFFLYLKTWNPTQVAKLFFYFILLILVGSTLEIFTFLNNVSDQFRLAVYPRWTYESHLRDKLFYGMIRPKLFAREPSHVSYFFLISIYVWFALSKNKRKYIVFAIFCLWGISTIRSPTILLSIPLAFIIEIFLYKKIKIADILMYKRSTSWLFILLFFLGSVFFVGFAESMFFSGRYQYLQKGRDNSFIGRISGPPLVAFRVIEQYPIFGAGITGKEAIHEIKLDAFYDLGMKKAHNITVHSGANFFFLFIIYYGVIGSFLVILFFHKFLKMLGINNSIFVVSSICVFGQAMGGFVSLKPWFTIFLIVLIAYFFAEMERIKLPSKNYDKFTE